jgi:hypothetical protein
LFNSLLQAKNWEQIDDEQALSLILEILENTSEDSILKRNGNALEKRYAKSEGTVMDLIFQEDLNNPRLILDKLKINTVISL